MKKFVAFLLLFALKGMSTGQPLNETGPFPPESFEMGLINVQERTLIRYYTCGYTNRSSLFITNSRVCTDHLKRFIGAQKESYSPYCQVHERKTVENQKSQEASMPPRYIEIIGTKNDINLLLYELESHCKFLSNNQPFTTPHLFLSERA